MRRANGVSRSHWILGGLAGLITLSIVMLIALAALPFSLMKNTIARKASEALGAPVSIGSVERREALSFTPTIVVRNLYIRQPEWAGKGAMVEASQVEFRLAILPLLLGQRVRPDSIVAHGLNLALVRDRLGRANWNGPNAGAKASSEDSGLSELRVSEGRISLRDYKRSLIIAGSLTSNAKGLLLNAAGTFHDRPTRIALRAAPIVALKTDTPYPFRLDLASPLLHLQAQGHMRGALNTRAMTLDMRARAANLKYLDDMIEAGLFGTNPIDLSAKVRHAGQDWLVDQMAGRIGRSSLNGKATILKRDGRTKIDGDIRFASLDFDDLADAHGRAKAKAIEARIGERVFPGTRINLANVGPTDGVIRLRADRLLLGGSAFRSLSGVIRLDGKQLTIDDIVVGMASGQMKGTLRIDQRSGAAHPRLSIDFRLTDDRLERVLGTDAATGPLRGRIILSGRGDTIRDALAHADGRVGILVQNGSIKRTFAAVLGQDLGKTIGAALKDADAQVPLRCLAAGFIAKNGIVTPSPLLIATDISTGRGEGQLSLATEKIALSLNGQSREPSGLRLTDPILIAGTFSNPSFSISGRPASEKMGAGSVLKVLGKSIGDALGLGRKVEAKSNLAPMIVDCPALARRVL